MRSQHTHSQTAQPLILTFDMGTQSARALLISRHGDVLAKAQKVYTKPYLSPEPGWAEQSADFYWDALCETGQTLREKNPQLWGDIIAVTVSTIRDTCVCLDEDNNPLRNVILWLDQREALELQDLPPISSLMFQLARMGDAVALQRKVSVSNWIASHQPQIWEKTKSFALISTWLNYKLCGRLVDSVASTVGHIPFDSKIRGWMRPTDIRRRIFNVPDNKLYPLVEPGTVMGRITAQAAKLAGIPQGLPLIATGSDKACETLGLGCLTPEKAALSFGTTATVEICTPDYLEPLPFIPPYPAVVKDRYNPEVEIYRGYWLISWFKKEFAAKEVEDAHKKGVSAEQLLNQRLHEVPPGSDGLIFQPYFTPGLIMPHARGAVIGFSDVHTRLHIYRAIIEGINFSLMEGLYSIQQRGKLKVNQLLVAGGGSQSSEICQITANMFGLPVHRTQTHEVTGVGSSLAAFVAMGIFNDYQQAVDSMVHIKDTFMPDMQEHQIYNQLYHQIFIKIFDHLSPLYRHVSNILVRA